MKAPMPGDVMDFAVLKAMFPPERIHIRSFFSAKIPLGSHICVRSWRDPEDGLIHRGFDHWIKRDERHTDRAHPAHMDNWRPSTDNALALSLVDQLATGSNKPWFFTLRTLSSDHTPRFDCEFRSRSVDWKAVYVGRGHQVSDTICQAIYFMYKRGIVRGGVTAVGKRADWMRL